MFYCAYACCIVLCFLYFLISSLLLSHPIPPQPQWLPDVHAGDSPLFFLLEDDAVSATSAIASLPTDDEPTGGSSSSSRGGVAEESEDDGGKAAASGMSDLPPAGSSKASNSVGDASASTSIVNSSTGHVSDSERVLALEEQNRELLARIAVLTKQRSIDTDSSARGTTTNIPSTPPTSPPLPAASAPPLSPSSPTSEVSKMIEDMSKQRVSCTAFDVQPAAAAATLVGTVTISGKDGSASSISVQGGERGDPLEGVDALLAQVSRTVVG